MTERSLNAIEFALGGMFVLVAMSLMFTAGLYLASLNVVVFIFYLIFGAIIGLVGFATAFSAFEKTLMHTRQNEKSPT